MMATTAMMNMQLSHLPLRPSTLARLQQRGFMTTKELDDSKRRGGMINVAHELGLDINEAASLVREVESSLAMVSNGGGRAGPTLRTAADLFSEYHHHGNKQNNRSIITVCRALDRLLGDGLPRAELTEVVGMPGVGKTQLAMQLSVTTRLLASYGGVEGQAIYLDTEGSFSPERCYSMAQALIHHVQATLERRRQQHLSQISQQLPSDRQNKTPPPLPAWWTAEYMLQGINVYRIHDEAALQATLHALPNFIEEQEKQGHWPVRLVVVDSIAFPYRCAGSDYLARTRSLANVATILSDLSQQYNLAVMVTNHMTTQIVQGQSRVVPALGDSWAHAVTNRLLLSIPPQQPTTTTPVPIENDEDSEEPIAVGSTRKCSLIKSPHKPNADAYFRVLECGIRDLPLAPLQQDSNRSSDQISHAASKRLRAQY